MNISIPQERLAPTNSVDPVAVILVLALRSACELLSLELEDAGISVAGSCTTATEALELIPLLIARVAVIDTRLPDGTGYRLCRQAKSVAPGLRLLLHSSHDDAATERAAVVAGAHALVPRQINGSSLIPAIRRIAGGEDLIDARLRAAIILDLTHPDGGSSPATPDWAAGLDAVERRVLVLAAEGLDDAAISRWLGISAATVSSCFDTALQKIGY